MSQSLSVATGGAIKADVTDVSKYVSKYVSDDENWFAVSCLSLYSAKAGTALHYATGFDERSCYRYAAGQVKPPAYFLRALLRGDHGEQWLNATMADCTSQWWLQLGALRQLSSDYIVRKR